MRRSLSEWRTSSPATLPTPRTPSRTRSSRPGARSAAFAPASRCARGCSGSPRTRPATAAAPPAGATGSCCAAASLSGEAAPSPEDAALDAAQREQLLAALEELPADAREVLACRYLLDLSEEETAAALDVARGTVKSRTARALDRLKEAYGPRA